MRDLIPQLTLFRDWLRTERGRDFGNFAAMWHWSVTDLDDFWRSVWDYLDLGALPDHGPVVTGEMPDAHWFGGARINYAAQILRHATAADAAGQPAIIAQDETNAPVVVTWAELRRQSAALALSLRSRGIMSGDRVAAYLPNRVEAVIALLACASIGAVWTICAPDMGTPAVLDRLRQTEPKALIAADGVLYGGKQLDRSGVIAELRRGLPTVETVYCVATPHAAADTSDCFDFHDVVGRDDAEVAAFTPVPLPFEHPLWILYSSGTTGLPKAIVHGHGGIVLTCGVGNLHLDLGPSYAENTRDERFLWYSSTGWVMWNVQVSALLAGTTICLYDGSPKGSGDDRPWTALWRFACEHRVTWFGSGAAFYMACRKAAVDIAATGAPPGIRAIGTTGSPLDAETQRWVSEEFARGGQSKAWWCNISGGTDIVAAFMSGNRELPPAPGRLQCRNLGAAIESWSDDGQALIGDVGELVLTRPLPSMPLYFWGDPDRTRYRETYFGRWPGIWRHGDWLVIEPDGTCIISGRSDATINRHGLRMGTADIYAAVEALPAVEDSLLLDLDDGGGDSELLLFIVPAAGAVVDTTLVQAVNQAIRTSLSPRFVPDQVVEAPGIPRTLSGKKQELPIKRLMMGWAVEKVIDPNLTQNPEVLDWYTGRARQWQAKRAAAQTVRAIPSRQDKV